MLAHQVIKAFRLTEKSNQLSAEYGQYTFSVDVRSSKADIREAVEKTFKVAVTRVNVQHYLGKSVRSRTGKPAFRSDSKKAIVTLKAGDKIEIA